MVDRLSPDGSPVEQEVEEVRKIQTPGYLEAVSPTSTPWKKKHGPVILSACAPRTATPESTCRHR